MTEPDPQPPPAEIAGADRHLAAAHEVIASLGLGPAEEYRPRPLSGHRSSTLLPCTGVNGEPYLLKYFHPPSEEQLYPAGVRPADYARREAGFYRFLDSVDPERRTLPAPRTVLLDTGDPPRWLLLQRIDPAVGPDEEIMGQGHVYELHERIQAVPIDTVLARRNLPLNRWDTVSYLDRVRQMYDPVLFVIGERRWSRVQEFFKEALRWTENRQPVLVHGDFCQENITVDAEGRPYLLDFERVGIGNIDHDLAWFWIHSPRASEWKTALIGRYLIPRVGSDRIRAEWGIRSCLVYLALRRLRYGYLAHGQDPNATGNLALLDATLAGGGELFPC